MNTRKLNIAAFFAILMLLAIPVTALAVTAPTLTPSGGSYVVPQSISMSAPAGSIFFTINGEDPTNLSTLYTAPISVEKYTVVKAVAYSSGTYSSVTSAYIAVDPNLAPLLVASPSGAAPGNPTMWLSANFGPSLETIGSPQGVSTWTDLSGNGNTATNSSSGSGTQPTILNCIVNNHAAVAFNGSQFLSLPTGFSSLANASVFIVANPKSVVAGANLLDLGNSSGHDFIVQFSPGSAPIKAALTTFDTGGTSTTTTAVASNAVIQNQFQLFEGTLTSSNVGTAYNNASPGTANSSMNAIPSGALSSNFIGKHRSGSNFFSGYIAEIILYANLTAAQRTRVESYLLQKYQLLARTPNVAASSAPVMTAPAPPVMSLPGGILTAPTQITISTEPGSLTYITTDNTTPSSGSTLYSNNIPINIDYSQTVRAISIKNGNSSSVSTAKYELNSSQWPQPSPLDTTAPTINLELPVPSI